MAHSQYNQYRWRLDGNYIHSTLSKPEAEFKKTKFLAQAGKSRQLDYSIRNLYFPMSHVFRVRSNQQDVTICELGPISAQLAHASLIANRVLFSAGELMMRYLGMETVVNKNVNRYHN